MSENIDSHRRTPRPRVVSLLHADRYIAKHIRHLFLIFSLETVAGRKSKVMQLLQSDLFANVL